MTPTQSVPIIDPYLYNIPRTNRRKLCQVILRQNFWQTLAEHMGYDKIEIDEMKSYTYETNDKEAEELLIRWGEQNHTITELFVLLSRIPQYTAMDTIKDLVDSRYHRLIKECQLTDPMSDDNNESGRPRNDDKHGGLHELKDNAITKIDYEVLRDATHNWSKKNVLGRGGFGTVFKGRWLDMAVAIKRIENRDPAKAEMGKIQIEQSLNELRHLNCCRHDNILPLYGVSINGDDPCLVYQLMQGGSLEERLFHRSSGVSPLTWQQRINIAVGTARGLRFLHTFQKRPLIHSDIKPANILLDSMNEPKIGDFGLVREGNEEQIETIVSRVFGTRPYLPEELICYKKLTTKVDSYSFGIVLFEISTGQRALNKKTNKFLIETIKYHDIQGNLVDLIDETAGNNKYKENIFLAFIELGKDCTKREHEDRPDMVKVLEFFEEKFDRASDVNACSDAIAKIDYGALRDGTNNWSEENVLGKGGFGTVFKGKWFSKTVAVKRIPNVDKDTPEMSKIQESLDELNHLNSFRHTNILPLYGASIDGDEPCLVHQLMQNGSLEDTLFNRSTNVTALKWKERLNIADGVARGLRFLHTFRDLPFIHRNIRPSNIFLSPMNEPKIGSPYIGETDDNILVNQMNKDETKGSRNGMFPYLPIEYIQLKNLTTKVDSYSFGIVLFELSTGQRAYDRETGSFLYKTIESHDRQGKLFYLMDDAAENDGGKGKIFKTLIDLGKECTKYNSVERPDMDVALKCLQE